MQGVPERVFLGMELVGLVLVFLAKELVVPERVFLELEQVELEQVGRAPVTPGSEQVVQVLARLEELGRETVVEAVRRSSILGT